MGLFTPKWKNRDREVREQWVKKANPEKLKHNKILIELAKNDENEDVRRTAVTKLTDLKALADIAKNDEAKDVCIAAVEKLSDQSALADVAKNAKEKNVRLVAIENITDYEILKEISQKDKSINVRLKVITKLIEIGNKIDLNIKDYSGKTILHYACNYDMNLRLTINGHLGRIKFLLENNANPNIQDKKGATPLHMIAKMFPTNSEDDLEELKDIIALFHKYEADFYIKNNKGVTPSESARNSGQYDLADFIF